MKLTAVVLLFFASCNACAPQDSLFRPAVLIALPNKPSNVARADLNKDGRLDLIITSEEARTVVSEPRAVATGPGGIARRDAQSVVWPHYNLT